MSQNTLLKSMSSTDSTISLHIQCGTEQFSTLEPIEIDCVLFAAVPDKRKFLMCELEPVIEAILALDKGGVS